MSTPPGGFTDLLQRLQAELPLEQSHALEWLRESNTQTLQQWQDVAGNAVALAKSFAADCQLFNTQLETNTAAFLGKLTSFLQNMEFQAQYRVDVGELRIRFQLEMDRLTERLSQSEKSKSAAVARAEQLEQQLDTVMGTVKQQKECISAQKRDIDVLTKKCEHSVSLQSKLEDLRWQAESRTMDEKKRADNLEHQVGMLQQEQERAISSARDSAAATQREGEVEISQLRLRLSQMESDMIRHVEADAKSRQLIEQLQQNNATLETQLEQQRIAVQQVTSHHETRQSELLTAIRTRDSHLDILQADVLRLQRDRDFLESSKKDETFARERLERELVLRQERIDELLHELRISRGELEQRDGHARALQNQIAVLGASAFVSEQEIDGLRRQLQESAEDKTRLQEELAAARVATEDCKAQLVLQVQRFNAVQQGASVLKEKLFASERAVEDETHRYSLLASTAAELSDLLQRAQNESAVHAANVTAQAEVAKEYEAKLAREAAVVVALTEEISALKTENRHNLEACEQRYNENLRGVVDGQQALLVQVRQSAEEHAHGLKARIVALEASIQVQQTQTRSLEEEIENWQRIANDGEKANALLHDEKEHLHAQLSQELEAQNALLDQMRSELLASCDERDRLSDRLKQTQTEVVNLCAQRDEDKQCLEAFRMQVLEAREQRDQHMQQLAVIRDEVQILQGTCMSQLRADERSRSLVEQHEKEILSLKSSNADISARLVAAEGRCTELTSISQQVQADYELKLASERDSSTVLRARLEKEISDLSLQCALQQDRIDSLGRQEIAAAEPSSNEDVDQYTPRRTSRLPKRKDNRNAVTPVKKPKN
eukprot:TRINITY_DN14566_c0_g1_i1.p1 TRINITY_DN14566_c0_g1~~TRINITY_DN14566_c0_g1_i1.p1  ORF type:complete len:854 (-),score=199.72 TRINITY_DN14566_c0_g1_i1:133-2646(-)